MEYLNGGDLYSLLRNLGCLDEDVARVYIAEVVSTCYFFGFIFTALTPWSWITFYFLYLFTFCLAGACFRVFTFTWCGSS